MSARPGSRWVHTALAGLVWVTAAGVLVACHREPTSEQVADQFADAYFRRYDQEAALAYTALGATEMLDKELLDTKAIRESGYTPAEAAASVTFVRGEARPRDARIGYHYSIAARVDDSAPVTHEADIELARIGGAWKVVTVRLVEGRDRAPTR